MPFHCTSSCFPRTDVLHCTFVLQLLNHAWSIRPCVTSVLYHDLLDMYHPCSSAWFTRCISVAHQFLMDHALPLCDQHDLFTRPYITSYSNSKTTLWHASRDLFSCTTERTKSISCLHFDYNVPWFQLWVKCGPELTRYLELSESSTWPLAVGTFHCCNDPSYEKWGKSNVHIYRLNFPINKQYYPVI